MAEKKKRSAKRRPGEGSVYRRKDGRYVAEITLQDGKRKQYYFKKEEDAIAKKNQAIYEVKQGVLATGSRQKLGDHLNWWLEEVHKQRIREGTYLLYRGVLTNHILPQLGHIQLQKLTTHKIQSFCIIKLKENQSASSVRTMHNVLRKGLRYAVTSRLLPFNPCDGISLPVASKRKVIPLTLEQARQLMIQARGTRLEALVALAITTGMRHGEIAALRWEDVDFEQGSIFVHRSVSYRGRYKYVEGAPKTQASERLIPLAPAMIDLFKTHRIRQHEMRLKAGERWKDLHLVFSNKHGGFWNPDQLRFNFYRLLEQAGLPRMHLHDLRHCASTLFQSLGVQPKVVQAILGHSTLDMTMNTYSHVLPAMQKEAAERINRLF